MQHTDHSQACSTQITVRHAAHRSQSGMQHTDHSQACSTQITVRHAAHRSQSGMQHTDHSQACSTQITVRHAAHRSQSGMQHTDHSQACSTQITVRHAAHRSQSGMQHTDHSQACSTQITVRHAAHRSQSGMQHSMDLFSTASNNFGLTNSTNNTKVMHQSAPGKAHAEPTTTVNGQKLSAVDSFTYLGSTLFRALHSDDEVVTRIARASEAFGRLRSNVCKRRGISLETKLKAFKAVILPAWTVYSRHAKKHNQFLMSCLGKLMKIKWQDKIPDSEVLARGRHNQHPYSP